MTEQIIQGDEDPAKATARRAAWLSSAGDRLPENTPDQLGDIVRALLDSGILTLDQIAAAKRNR